uniref:Uncharacterized protein n=1 Tax=Ursus maritimus TaxID=29073 RepID=A0A452V428_URSMA
MALLLNALSCHFRIPIRHMRSPDRSGKISFIPSLFSSPWSHPFSKPKSETQILGVSLSLSLSLSRPIEELPFPL